MEKKNTGLIILIIVLSILVVGLGGYIVYDKVFTKEKEEVSTKNETKEEAKIELSNAELEEYLSYVPIKEELNNYEDYNIYYNYTNDAYSGNLETISSLSKDLLMAKVFNLSQKATTKEKSNFTWCGDSTACEGDEYVTIDTFNNTITKMYNIKNIDVTKFTINGGGVEKTDKYYVSYHGRGGTAIKKYSETINYEIKNNDLIIYERASFIYKDTTNNKISILKTTDPSSIIKSDDGTNYNTDSAIITYAQSYMNSNQNEFNTFKHTFKLNENNAYYWYSTELNK